MKELSTEIEINAPADRVWRVLTDFAAYPEWNSFVTRLKGEAIVGTRLDAIIRPPGGKAMAFQPIVLAANTNSELRWLGHLWFPGLFDGEHCFVIEPLTEGRIRFTQRERFSGLLVPIVWRRIDRDIRRGFEEMNSALKLRSESELP